MKRTSVLWVVAAGLLMGAPAQAQQRSTGTDPRDLERQRTIEQLNDQLRAVRLTTDNLNGYALTIGRTLGGAWWTNKALLERIGLTDDQKARIERAFENHRYNIESNQKALEKEEAQLARLLDAEKIDRGAILSQIDRVTQARSELERTNSVMTLEMREVLTRTQWTQLPQTRGTSISYWENGNVHWETGPAAIRIQTPGEAPAAPRGGGARGQRQ